jgi:hypothetical protein
MPTIEELQIEIEKIKTRNQKVESDKAWEISWSRKILIAILTYLVIVIFFFAARFPQPFLSALVPTIGFILSTLTISLVKRLWLKYFHNQE